MSLNFPGEIVQNRAALCAGQILFPENIRGLVFFFPLNVLKRTVRVCVSPSREVWFRRFYLDIVVGETETFACSG